jgi:putative flavoprotein involved in K+ transport
VAGSPRPWRPCSGWLARARRLLEHEPPDCPEQGYLLLPAAMEQAGEADLVALAQFLQGAAAVNWLSGPHPGNEPVRAGSRVDRLTTPLLWFAFSRVLSVGNPVGRRLRPKLLTVTAPLGRVRRRDLDAAGVERVPRTVGARDGLPLLEDGRALEVANVVWCTGFRHDFSWIDLPVFDAGDEPRQDHGVVAAQPGLYFVGLHFLSSIVSPLVGGVGRDAAHVAARIAAAKPAKVAATA